MYSRNLLTSVEEKFTKNYLNKKWTFFLNSSLIFVAKLAKLEQVEGHSRPHTCDV